MADLQLKTVNQAELSRVVGLYFQTYNLDRALWERKVLIGSSTAEFRAMGDDGIDTDISYYELLYCGEEGNADPAWWVHYKNRTRETVTFHRSKDREWSINWILNRAYTSEKIEAYQHKVKAEEPPPDTDTLQLKIDKYFSMHQVEKSTQSRLALFDSGTETFIFTQVDRSEAVNDNISRITLTCGNTYQWTVTHMDQSQHHHKYSNYDPDEWSILSVLQRLYTANRLRKFNEKIALQEQKRRGTAAQMRSLALLDERLEQLLLLTI